MTAMGLELGMVRILRLFGSKNGLSTLIHTPTEEFEGVAVERRKVAEDRQRRGWGGIWLLEITIGTHLPPDVLETLLV